MKATHLIAIALSLFATFASAAETNYVTGKITSLKASAAEPAIRIGANLAPALCDGGTYNWIYFQGTEEQKTRIYSSALALAMTGHTVTIYTNSDGTRCRINNIQALGLNP